MFYITIQLYRFHYFCFIIVYYFNIILCVYLTYIRHVKMCNKYNNTCNLYYNVTHSITVHMHCRMHNLGIYLLSRSQLLWFGVRTPIRGQCQNSYFRKTITVAFFKIISIPDRTSTQMRIRLF